MTSMKHVQRLSFSRPGFLEQLGIGRGYLGVHLPLQLRSILLLVFCSCILPLEEISSAAIYRNFHSGLFL